MTKDEAIHKALKVLNCLNNDRVYETAWVKGAINACEEALEQPAQEPLTRAQQVIRANNTAQPTQEPVAWGNPKYNYAVHHKVKSAWQGLTDDEIEEIIGYPVDAMYSGDYQTFREVEAKLKEKNYD